MLKPVLFALIMLGSTGCIHYTHTDLGDLKPLNPPDPTEAVSGAYGYFAMTATFDLTAFFGYPSMLVDLRNLDSGDTLHLIVTPADMEAFGKDRPSVPIAFRVPPGKYELTKSQLHVPGGSHGTLRFDPYEQPLDLEKHLDPFTIEAGKLLHVGVYKFTMHESLAGRATFRQTNIDRNFKQPQPFVWKPFEKILQTTPFVFLRKSQNGTFTTEVAKFTPADFDPANSDNERQKVHDKIVEAHRAEIKACNAKHSPKAHGKVVVSYVLTGAGTVDVATVKSTTLKETKTEECILEIFRKLTFTKPPHGNADSWWYSWTF